MSGFDSFPKLSFLLVRAGATDLDNQGRILGSLNLPLSESGAAQVAETATELLEFPITMIYSAACLSAQQTTRALTRDGKRKFRVEENLTNLNCGLWHGKSLAELRDTQPTLFKQWKEHPAAVKPPQGESVEAVQQRVRKLLKKIHSKHKFGMVVIVAPEPLISIIRNELNDCPLAGANCKSLPCGGWESVLQPETVAVL